VLGSGKDTELGRLGDASHWRPPAVC